MKITRKLNKRTLEGIIENDQYTFWSYASKKATALNIIFSVIWSLFESTFSILLASISVWAGKKSEVPFLWYTGGFVVYIILWEFLEYVGDIYGEYTRESITNEVYIRYMHRVYNLKPSIIKQYNSGYISGLINAFCAKYTSLYQIAVLMVPLGITYVIFFSIYLCKFHWIYSVEFFVIVILAVSFKAIGKKIFPSATSDIEDYAEADGERNKLELDVFANIGTVQKLRGVDFFDKKIRASGLDVCQKSKRANIWLELIFCGFKAIGMMFVPLVMITFYLAPNTVHSEEFWTIIAMIGIKLIHTVKSLADIFTKYERWNATRKKLDVIVNPENMRISTFVEDFETLELRDVNYIYAKVNEEHEVTSVNVIIPHFQIKKGDFCCIHGESGQGKTTLINLLSQEIENDGVYINGEKVIDQRVKCAFIAQDTEMFDLSLRENLCLGKGISDDTLLYFLEQVGLSDWYQKQKDGLDTILGERGVFVSTGQRQRLNLIRGLLVNDCEVYMLDEPTSNVDEETELKMVQLIKEVTKGKTVVVVTHRPKIMELANKVYLFEHSILKEN